MHSPIIRTDKSAFDRVRDAILNRGDSEENEKPTGPGTPLPG
ncbi:hypothetical protein [Haloprofundus halobius]|nr:hypothetical protein [Haloprofundus halobius]